MLNTNSYTKTTQVLENLKGADIFLIQFNILLYH